MKIFTCTLNRCTILSILQENISFQRVVFFVVKLEFRLKLKNPKAELKIHESRGHIVCQQSYKNSLSNIFIKKPTVVNEFLM